MHGKYCAFHDAADIIDPDQIEKAVRLTEEHDYDVVQSAFFRKNRSILSHFLLIDARKVSFFASRVDVL